MTQQKIPLIVDGVEYDLDTLPQEIRNLAHLYRRWENELAEKKLDIAKTEYAMKFTANEIIGLIKQYEQSKEPTNVT